MSENLTAIAQSTHPENHKNLLLAEAAAWLHDFWKCTDEHIQRKAAKAQAQSNDTGNDSTSSEDPDAYKKNYFSLVGSHQVTLFQDSASFEELIGRTREDKEKSWLVRVLDSCHGAAHSEKEDVYRQEKQLASNTRRSTPFGYESGPLGGLTEQLEKVTEPLRNLPPGQFPKRSNLKSSLEKVFREACADTRWPINEVTLWDWSDMVAALYKSALVASVLQNAPIDPDQMRWRLLSVRLNGAAFAEPVARIPDLLARRALINNGLNRVRELLEETYPLGTEVYRDENGSVFVVPCLDELLDLQDEQGDTLSTVIVRKFQEGTIEQKRSLRLDGEVVPFLQFKQIECWSRNEIGKHQPPLPIVKHIKDPTALSYPHPDSLKSWWRGQPEDICTVCQLRPQGSKARDYADHYYRRWIGKRCPSSCHTCKAIQRRVCGICEERREDRSKRWATRELNKTIWMDEIADVNGRLALIVGKFDLVHWLDGQLLFYSEKEAARTHVVLKVKNLGAALSDGASAEMKGHRYKWQEALGVFISEEKNRLRDAPRRFKTDIAPIDGKAVQDVDPLPGGGYRIKFAGPISSTTIGQRGLFWGQNFRVVGDGSELETDRAEAVEFIREKLLHADGFIVEQSFELPEMVGMDTPARLQRVWETTQQFWQERERDFKTDVGEVYLRLRIQARGRVVEPRQRFVLEGNVGDALGDYHTYELKLGSVNLSVVYTDEGEFITVDNLERTAVLLSSGEKPPRDYRDAAKRVFERLVGDGRDHAILQNQVDAAMYVFERLVEEDRKAGGIQIEQPTGYGSANKPLGRLHLVKELRFEEALEPTAYIPANTILNEPSTFMAIVPATKALNVACRIKRRYETEMGKVRNRLPLTIGVVFADRRTPILAVLDAGRRMLKKPTQGEDWTVEEITEIAGSTNTQLPQKAIVSLKRGQERLSIEMRTVVGNRKIEAGEDAALSTPESEAVQAIEDGAIEDVWYPYWWVKKDASGSAVIQRERQFIQMKGQFEDRQDAIWVHVRSLRKDDVVSFTPSRFDFQFLDAASQRFEVSYEDSKRRGGNRLHPCRPYYLEEFDDFECLWKILAGPKGLTTTQIHNLMGFIESKRQEWFAISEKSAFERIVRDALDNAEWKIYPGKALDSNQFGHFCQAAINGQLADVVELYMHILKTKTEVDKMEERKQ